MNVAGHLAFAFLSTEPLHARQARLIGEPRDLRLDALVMFGALIPDLIDKPLRLIGFTPHGRSIGHALLVWALFACIAVLSATLYPRMRAVALLAYGWGTHFVADTLDDLVAGLESTGYLWTSWAGWPWVTADSFASTSGIVVAVAHLSSLEVVVVLIAAMIMVSHQHVERRESNEYSIS